MLKHATNLKLIVYIMVVSILSCFSFPTDAAAFKVRPEGSDNEGRIRYLEETFVDSMISVFFKKYVYEHFTSPVHEEIIHRAFGCNLPGHQCGESSHSSHRAPDAVVAGVRWNDNPPFTLDAYTKEKFKKFDCNRDFTAFKLPNFSKCWCRVFKDAADNASTKHYRGTEYSLVYRVHFGDMQFLHSMASWDGEKARDTRARIMMWAEFSYRFAIGDIKYDTELRKTGINGMDLVFKGYSWTAERLFTIDDLTYRNEKSVRLMALGSLLHMIQDSFSKSHVRRDSSNAGGRCEKLPEALKPGIIEMFYAFNNQDASKHDENDSQDGIEVHLLSITPNVVKVCQNVLQCYNAHKPWQSLKEYLDCVYEVSDEDVPAESGVDFQKD